MKALFIYYTEGCSYYTRINTSGTISKSIGNANIQSNFLKRDLDQLGPLAPLVAEWNSPVLEIKLWVHSGVPCAPCKV